MKGIPENSLEATSDRMVGMDSHSHEGLGVAGGESVASCMRAPLETSSVLLSHLACIYMGPEKGLLFLNYACGFAPLFYQNQAKCYSTTLHKVNDTTWPELFPEIWHSSGTLKALKGLDARTKSCPWSHIEVPQVLIYQWHIYSLLSVNSIRRFICKVPEKPGVPWHRIAQSSLDPCRIKVMACSK